LEASALQAPVGLGRFSLNPPLLRLRSDDQLVAIFRAGNDEAFRVIHDRYRQRLFAYTRQMLSGSRQDAEDALQDVFVRAYSSLRSDNRPIALRAWLYRVAHNRCIDQLRRPTLAPADMLDLPRMTVPDPLAEAERREDLARLIADVRRLPTQQRSALLMRELDGLSYNDLAEVLDVTVPAVKSLLVRARVGLAQSAEARDTACNEIREELALAHGRGVRANGLTRRHLRECDGCREYRSALRGVQRSFAALAAPAALGPLGLFAKLTGIGGSGGGAAAGGSAAGGGATAAGGGVAAGGGGVAAGGAAAGGISATALTATATKVVVVVATAVVTAGGAVNVERTLVGSPTHATEHAVPAIPRVAPVRVPDRRPPAHPRAVAPKTAPMTTAVAAPSVATPQAAPDATATPGTQTSDPTSGSGGVVAPDDPGSGDAPPAGTDQSSSSTGQGTPTASTSPSSSGTDDQSTSSKPDSAQTATAGDPPPPPPVSP
jgi:RNA polymerase sigma factor (sigma-70 family)